MLKLSNRCRIMFVLEHQRKSDRYNKRIDRKYKPDIRPHLTAVYRGVKTADEPAACRTSEDGTKTVGHHHEQALSGRTDLTVRGTFNE